VRREAVSARPTRSSRRERLALGQAQPETPVRAADQHRHQRPRQMREAGFPLRRRGSQPLGRRAVQGGAGDDDVGAGQPVVTRRDHQVEPARVAARVLHDHRAGAPAQRRQHRRRLAAAADQQLGQRRRQGFGSHCRQRGWPPLRRQMPPRRPDAQGADLGRQAGGFGQPQRLRPQPGVVLGQNPGARLVHARCCQTAVQMYP